MRRVGNALVAGDLSATGKPVVALVGHLDTVPGHEDDAPARREGDLVYGLGASDMKGGVAVAMALAEDLDLAALPVTVWLIFYDKEEGPHEDSGLGPLMAQVPELSRIDLAIVMEPTDDVVQVGCVGSVHATITFQGRRAHAARPWHGENAITKAGRLLAELHTRAPKEVEVGGHVFREVMTVTTCEGGRYRNVVPDRMALNLNYRFAPGRTVDEARADVEALVGGEATIAYVDLAPERHGPRREPPLREAPRRHRSFRRAQAGVDRRGAAGRGGDRRGEPGAGAHRPGAPARRALRGPAAHRVLPGPGALPHRGVTTNADAASSQGSSTSSVGAWPSGICASSASVRRA